MASDRQRLRGHAAPKPSVDELLASRERMNRVSADFLKTDLNTALTFVQIARQTRDAVRKTRNCRAARRAYETIVKLCDKVYLSEADGHTIGSGLKRLRIELEELGEKF